MSDPAAHELRILVTVERVGGFTAAAEAVRTQPVQAPAAVAVEEVA
ncbi:MAG TPA: hypothetical protein VGJ44_01845 [Kribbellaceae bacterium]